MNQLQQRRRVSSLVKLTISSAIQTSGIDISRDNYLHNVYDATFYNNEQYAIPLDIHTTLLYYNKDLLKKQAFF